MLLRPPVPGDAAQLFERVAHDPEVIRYLTWVAHPTVATTRRVIVEKINATPTDRTSAITLRDGGAVIGLLSCRRTAPHSVEIGYCIGQRWWGLGLMSESLTLVMTALAGDPSLYRVWATCHVANSASARLLERAGFTREGQLARHAVYPNLGPLPDDSLLYGIAVR